MEVEVPGVDPELVRELAVRQVLVATGAERLEHSEPQRVAERFQLLGPLEREHVQEGSGLSRGHWAIVAGSSCLV